MMDALSDERIVELSRVVNSLLSGPFAIDYRSRQTLQALLNERDTLRLDLDRERAMTRACTATAEEWREMFKRCLAIESDLGTPEEMEHHVTRLIETLRESEKVNESLLADLNKTVVRGVLIAVHSLARNSSAEAEQIQGVLQDAGITRAVAVTAGCNGRELAILDILDVWCGTGVDE